VARRKTLSDHGVAGLKRRPTRYSEPDPELQGHYIRVTPNGSKSFVAVARDPEGRQIWATIGSPDLFKVDEARERARDAIKRIRAGLAPTEAPAPKRDTFEAVAENWLRRHVHARGIRSEKEVTRLLKAHVYPHWTKRPFLSLKRSDVAELLDKVQDEHGARQADYVLAIVRGICNWFAARHDDYLPPIARGMRRTDPKSRKRARILDDDELRTIWTAAEESGTFGAIVRVALLTAQRREKLATLRWEDVSDEGEWRIATEDREKGTGGSLVLPDMALAIIRAQPRYGKNPYVFAGRGTGHFNGFSPCKRALDAKTPDVTSWVIHDLRRTARSLMSRAGVRPDVAERVMGHTIPGVEGVYDRHSYRAEKQDALKRLAALVQTIVDPESCSGRLEEDRGKN
jgi:integrase